MAPKSDKLSKKQRRLERTEVCAKNLSNLSNNDVKTVLSNYRFLSEEEKEMVRQFNTDLKWKHHNRFCNLSKFFKQAYDSDLPVRLGTNYTDQWGSIREYNYSENVIVSPPISNQTKPEVVINKPSTSTNNNSVVPIVTQESAIAPFHTNIISSRVSNNIVNINPFYSKIFPMIHQKVINQCFSSLLPQVIMNNTINNITAALNFSQNINSTCDPLNNGNTSQNESSKSQSKKFDEKCVLQNSHKKIDNATKKFNESKNNYVNKTQFGVGKEHEKDSQNVSFQKFDSSTSKRTNSKESETIQDLESFSLEHMKKIENFAEQNASKKSIKFNLSSNSQIKMSETYSKIKQHTDSKTINLTGIKTFFDDTNLNGQHKIGKETKIAKTSNDDANKRLIDKSKVKNNLDVYSKEKCRSDSNDYHREDVPSKSTFLDECNILKSIISKNANIPEKGSMKKEKLEVIVSKKSKKSKKTKKFKNSNLKLVELNDQPISNETLIPEQKKQIELQEDKTISCEKDLIKENVEQVEIHNKMPKQRVVKVVNRVLRSDNSNDQIIKSISEKPFSEECNKLTNNTILETKPDVKCKLDKTMDTEDLMVLLKYFYKLNAMEQHRLIEFLKEMELTEPERVADLRKHVRTSPPEDEDDVLQNPAPEVDPVEIDDRPESRNSDLSNIDLILEDIDSILNDDDNDESSSTEPASKRLKTDLKSNEFVKNDSKCDSTISSGENIPTQFQNSQDYTFAQNSNTYNNNNPSLIQYNNMTQHNIDNFAQYQNYGYDHQNQYFQNLQQTYQLDGTELYIQNQNTSFQNQQNFHGFENYYYNNEQVWHYQQNYPNYQNNGYFQ